LRDCPKNLPLNFNISKREFIQLTGHDSSIKTRKQPTTMIGCFITLTGSLAQQNASFYVNVIRGEIMRSISLVFLILIILISGCSGNNPTKERSIPMMLYDFNEPYRFPFEVNDVRTEISIDNPYALHQYVFHYKNKQTTQEINYILSNVIDKPEKVSEQGRKPIVLINGKMAYYEEDENSQSIWWESENGFLARFIYHVNGYRDQLGNYKLDESDLIDLANQVQ
jgi:hypothetical protein